MTIRSGKTGRESRLVEGVDFLKTAFAVRHLLVGTIVLLLVFAIVMLLLKRD